MDQDIELHLGEIHKKQQIIWFTVLFGMIGLVAVSLMAYSFSFIDPIPVVDPAVTDKITMFMIVVFLIISFYIKRNTLSLSKIINKASSAKIPINKNLWPIQNNDKKSQTLASAIQIVGRNRLFVWFIADLIIIFSVINFILAPVVNSFIIYCTVALYSLLINFPSYKFFSKIYRYIYED